VTSSAHLQKATAARSIAEALSKGLHRTMQVTQDHSGADHPYERIYSGEFLSRSEAFNREKFFKTMGGYTFLKSIGIY
jgi:hypothetical protein